MASVTPGYLTRESDDAARRAQPARACCVSRTAVVNLMMRNVAVRQRFASKLRAMSSMDVIYVVIYGRTSIDGAGLGSPRHDFQAHLC